MPNKKFPVVPPSIWTDPPPEPPRTVPDGFTEIVRLADSFERYIIEILEPCFVAGRVAAVGDQFEMYAEEAGQLVCAVPIMPGLPCTANARAKIIEVIPPRASSRVRKLGQNTEKVIAQNEADEAKTPKGPRVVKLPAK